MRLVTYRQPGELIGEPGRVGIVSGNGIVDLAAAAEERGRPQPAFRSMLALIDAGPRAMDLAREIVDAAPKDGPLVHPADGVDLLSPVPLPRQIRDFSAFETHIRQAGAAMARIRGNKDVRPEDIEVPAVYREQPVYYKANRFTVVGDGAEVLWPRYSQRLDFELEFGVFIAKRGRDIAPGDAAGFIFGYSIFNDFSARDTQGAEMRGMLGPAKGKDFDTGNAIGPCIVTPDEVPDVYDLSMTVRVNGEAWSTGTTADMMHSFEEMIAYVSRDETIFPGEFLGSGTVGNGCGLELDRWLKPDDEIALEVEVLGTLTNRVVPVTGERLRRRDLETAALLESC